MSLGTKLHALRRRKKLSLQDVATALVVSKTHVWDLEKGNSSNPSMDLLKKLADFYGVTVAYLVEPESEVDETTAEAKVFFRNFHQLDEKGKELVMETMKRFQKPKGR